MKILYLYEEVMGYTLATMQALSHLGHEVHVIHWDHRKITPFKPDSISGVRFYSRSQMTAKGMRCLASELRPDITVVSGWTDRGYLFVAQYLKVKHQKVVLALDGQWHASLKQYIACTLGIIRFFSLFYSHVWVPGPYQYEYARILGFKKNNIIFDLYSADLATFNSSRNSCLNTKSSQYPHVFLFVGRLEPIKGIDILLKAWQLLKAQRKDWDLVIIGNGSLKPSLNGINGVIVKEFCQPTELFQAVQNVGCFVLPSIIEPWGVVVHELSSIGTPLLLSDTVGSASVFLIEGMNGYSFRHGDPLSLAQKMKIIIDTPDSDLYRMACASSNLSNRITPLSSASNLLSVTN